MTEQKHLKALVRARMARTGESYTAARSHLVKRQAQPSLTPSAEFKAHDKHCMTAVFTPDGATLLTGGFGGQFRAWSPNGRMTGELAGHESSVNVIRVSPDGTTAVTASSDKTIRVWDLTAGGERGVLGRHRKQVLALDLDAERDRVWSGGHDGRLQAFGLTSGEHVASFDLGSTVGTLAVRSADGAVAVGTVGSGLVVVDRDGLELARPGGGGPIGSVAWASDGSFVIGSSRTGATVWASDQWEPVRTLQGGPGSLVPVAITADGSRLAMGWDRHLGLWSADESVEPAIVDGLPKGVYGLSFSPDGRSLAAASADGRVRTWRVT